MDLKLAPEDAAFRDEVIAFLDKELTPEMRARARLTAGVVPDHELRVEWHKTLHAKGWVAPAWPKEHGGTGWTDMQRYLFESECATAGAPGLASMGLAMVGPVIMGYGRDDQKAEYLPRILSGDDIWCQGYSEPGSGSDLASLQTKAVRDGDDYVINGTKIWTTGAHLANKMFCLVRTSSDGKPQQGITFLLLDMNSPGITVEPIITLAGDHEVNQVFFDDVRVPVANRVGDENQGWTVAKYLLEFERGGRPYAAGLQAALKNAKRIAGDAPAGDGGRLIDDPDFSRKLAQTEMEVDAVEYTEHRIMSALSAGQNPGAISSMIKLRGSDLSQRITELGLEAIGYYMAPYQPDARTWGSNVEPIGPDGTVTVTPRYLNSRAATIYGGSNEVQRNIMAKAVLGL